MKIYIKKKLIPIFVIMVLVVLFVKPYGFTTRFKDCISPERIGSLKGICIGHTEVIEQDYEYRCAEEGAEAYSKTMGTICSGVSIEIDRVMG